MSFFVPAHFAQAVSACSLASSGTAPMFGRGPGRAGRSFFRASFWCLALLLSVLGSTPLPAASLNVLLPSGSQVSVTFVEDDTVAAFKQRLQDQESVPMVQQRLLYSGTALADERTLESYQLNGGQTLQLVWQAVGGSWVFGAGGGYSSGGVYSQAGTVGLMDSPGVAAAAQAVEMAGFWQTLNAAPLVPVRSVTVQTGRNLSVSVAKLLARDTDEDGDSLGVLAVAASSSLGGGVVLTNGTLVYTPPAGGLSGTDSFTYTITDAGGDVTTGTILVTPLSGTGANIVFSVFEPSPRPAFTVKFVGIPGATYRMEMSSNLALWSTVANSLVVIPVSGSSAGVGTFIETNIVAGSHFYRTVYVSGP